MVSHSTLSKHPTLLTLARAPEGKTGWPWTGESEVLADTLPDGSPWPRVTIVTPSYNQAQFIEETIRSVLLQGYPNLEYIILDGGSTDGSVEIIRKYEPWLAGWVSEPDHGQVSAIAKGWSRSSGSILAYLNSDDTYLPNALEKAVRALCANPEAPAVCGGELSIDSQGMVISERQVHSVTWYDLLALNFVPQPAIFVRRSVVEQVGGLDPTFPTTFDFELWTRVAQESEFACIPDVLAATRWHPATKTLTRRLHIAAELQGVIRKLLTGPAGRRISWAKRRYIQARLNYVLVSIYLDDPIKYGWKILTHGLAALVSWPGMTFPTARLIFSNMLYRTVLFYLRVFKHKHIEELTAIQGRTGIHWNQWPSHPRGTRAHRD